MTRARGLADRFAGCLVGQAVGDATGYMVEGLAAAECAAYVQRAVRPRRLDEHALGPLDYGQYSDDTQLARELALSLVECGRLDPADYARRISAIFTEDRVVGRGRIMDAAARRLATGIPWHEAGEPAPAAGNGSAMRAAPIGVFLHHDFGAMLEAARLQGLITHADPRCTAGAIAVAGATAIAARRGVLHADEIAPLLSRWTREYDPLLSDAIAQLPAWVHRPPEAVFAQIAPIGQPPPEADGCTGVTPFVTPSVLWSLYSVLRTPHDYWEVIATAVAVGGDVDTTAAMAGAISGAALGLEAVPHTAARPVNDRGTWGRDALVRLGHDLYAAHVASRTTGA